MEKMGIDPHGIDARRRLYGSVLMRFRRRGKGKQIKPFTIEQMKLIEFYHPDMEIGDLLQRRLEIRNRRQP